MSSSRGPDRGDGECEVDELVGGVAHGRHDHDDLVAGVDALDDAAGDVADAVGIGHGGATVLLDD
jgi:hypothetical protein